MNAIARRYAAADDHAIDYGSAHLHARAELVREDRPDPDAPNRTIRGARRRDGLREMPARGQITAAQWYAVEDFRDDLARAGGARLEANEAGIRIAASPGRYGPTERQIDALRGCVGRCRRLAWRSAVCCPGW